MNEYGYNEHNISVEEQQKRLDALERRQNKYKWALLIFAGLTFGLVGLLWLVISLDGPQKINYMVLAAKEHSKKEIDRFMKTEDTNVVFERDTEGQPDSMANRRAFQPQPEKAELPAAYVPPKERKAEVSSQPVSMTTQEEEELPRWSFDEEFENPSSFDPQVSLSIRGRAEAGSQLLFTVGGYQEDLSYSLEFQNNYIQKEVGETTLFAYREAGVYLVRLWVEDENGNRKKVERIVDILEAPAAPAKKLVQNTRTETTQKGRKYRGKAGVKCRKSG